MIGKTLGHYRVVGKLGRGGMGEVYVAEDAKLDRKVALKVLPEKMAADQERRMRFEREAKTVAALNHPNIVTIHSVEHAEGTHFIIMELVSGKTLSELIPAEGMALSRLFEIAIPLADALATAHGQGITHRDLKPDNVMVTPEGRVKMLDFGLAKLREGAKTAGEDSAEIATATVTTEGKILGTVNYMSPEQAEGKPIDHRSDIFALGILLYEMATGRRPFAGDTPISTLSAILKDTPVSITEVKQTLPRQFGRVVGRCLEKAVDRRFQTALDVRNELEQLRTEVDSGEPTVSKRGSRADVSPARGPRDRRHGSPGLPRPADLDGTRRVAGRCRGARGRDSLVLDVRTGTLPRVSRLATHAALLNGFDLRLACRSRRMACMSKKPPVERPPDKPKKPPIEEPPGRPPRRPPGRPPKEPPIKDPPGRPPKEPPIKDPPGRPPKKPPIKEPPGDPPLKLNSACPW